MIFLYVYFVNTPLNTLKKLAGYAWKDKFKYLEMVSFKFYWNNKTICPCCGLIEKQTTNGSRQVETKAKSMERCR